jgi:NADH dehydrogenase [ubiquinone] 1 alpha subcomplex assembly factor 5
VRDLGALLAAAGYTLTTVDVDHVTVRYPHPFALLDDLRAMGETNAIVRRCAALAPRPVRWPADGRGRGCLAGKARSVGTC